MGKETKIYTSGLKVAPHVSELYRVVLTTQEFEDIAKNHNYNLSTLLNIVYGKSVLNHRTVPLIEDVHAKALSKANYITSELQFKNCRDRIMSYNASI